MQPAFLIINKINITCGEVVNMVVDGHLDFCWLQVKVERRGC